MNLRLAFASIAATLIVACRVAPTAADAGPVTVVARPILATTLVLGLPTYTSRATAEAAQPFADYLSSAIGIPVTIRMGEPYDELERWLRDGEIDVAELPPVAWVLLSRQSPGAVAVATPVIGGSPTYLGHVYVRADSPVQSLEDLRGKSFGYVDHESGSGYLFPRGMLLKEGLKPNGFFGAEKFQGDHKSVCNAVIKGARAISGEPARRVGSLEGAEAVVVQPARVAGEHVAQVGRAVLQHGQAIDAQLAKRG